MNETINYATINTEALANALEECRYIHGKTLDKDVLMACNVSEAAYLAHVDTIVTTAWMVTVYTSTDKAATDKAEERRNAYNARFENAVYSYARLFGMNGVKVNLTGLKNRLLLASVKHYTITSAALTEAKKDVKATGDAIAEKQAEFAANTLAGRSNTETEQELNRLQTVLNEQEKTVENLLKQPHNRERAIKPRLDNAKIHANAEARELVENAMYDCLAEVEYLSIEEMQQAYKDLQEKKKAAQQKNAKTTKTTNRPTEEKATSKK